MYISSFSDQVFNLGIIENGLICAIPYIFIVLTNYTGKFYDLLNSKQFVSTGNLRKIFNFIGSMSTAIMFIILPYPQSSVGKIAVLTAAGCFNQLPLRAGFFLSFSDVGGSFGPMLFAISNTIAQLPGFINPLIIAALAPDVSTEVFGFTGRLGTGLFSVKPGNSLNPKVFIANSNLGSGKFSVKPGIPLKSIPVNPKISV